MKLLDSSTISDLLRQSCDPDYYKNRFALRAWAVGDKAFRGAKTQPGSMLPDYPDLFPTYYEPGQSQRALVNWVLMLSKIAYYDPEPDFPDLDPVGQVVRQEIIKSLWRSKDTYGKYEVGPQAFRAFLDADGLGTGWVQIDTEDGNIVVRHHRLENVVWDKHANSPSHARYVACIHNLSQEDAVDRFGSDVIRHTTRFSPHPVTSAPEIPRVRIVEFWSEPMGGFAGTHAFIANDLGGNILEIEENDLGCLPFAHAELFPIPGMSRAMGRLEMQKATQEMRNAVERYVKLTLARGSGFDVGDVSGMNEDDVDSLMRGEVLPFIRYESMDEKPIQSKVMRVPAQDIPSGAFNYLALLDRDQSPESGSSDGDRANLTPRATTLGEVNRVQSGADIQTSWSGRQYARFLERTIEKMVKCAAKWQKAPVTINAFGQKMALNDPTEPNSAIEPWLQELSRVIVSEDQVQFRDKKMQANDSVAFLSMFMQDPYIDPMVLRRKIFEARGEKNPDEFLIQQQV